MLGELGLSLCLARCSRPRLRRPRHLQILGKHLEVRFRSMPQNARQYAA